MDVRIRSTKAGRVVYIVVLFGGGRRSLCNKENGYEDWE